MWNSEIKNNLEIIKKKKIYTERYTVSALGFTKILKKHFVY